MFVCLVTERMRKLREAKEEPTPQADMITSFFTPYFFITSRTLEMESAMNRGGARSFENGLSDSRGALSVVTTAWGRSRNASVERKALVMSDMSSGVPATILRLSRAGREVGLRTRAVTLWPGDVSFDCTSWAIWVGFGNGPLLNASATTREPVRPLTPMTRIRIFNGGLNSICECMDVQFWTTEPGKVETDKD